MAIVKIFGQEIAAEPVEQTAAGDFLMRARHHGPRTAPGTLILVKPSEVIEMAAAEMPGNAPIPADLVDHGGSLDAMEKAMAEELKNHPSPADLIAQHQEDSREGKTMPDRPIPPRFPPGHQGTSQ